MNKSEFKALLDEALKPINEQVVSLEQKYSVVSDKQNQVITLASESVGGDSSKTTVQPKRKINY